MDRSMLIAVAHHLWQSTFFAAAVGMLTLLFRRNRASLRHALWLAASLKFLVPFTLLTAIGSRFPIGAIWQSARHGASDVIAPASLPPQWLTALNEVATPLEPTPHAAVTAISALPQSASISVEVVITVAWLLGTLTVLAVWLARWLHVRRALRRATVIDLPFCVPVKQADSLLEPGIVGIVKAVLLLPKGIEQRLTRNQLQAVLAHEQCHVQRRDNLMAALHMIVEAVFWFHPLVWWLGSRLVTEREQACDEHVTRSGHASSAYAEGILNVCQHYLESKLPLVSGVSGADLRQRIERVVKSAPVVTVGSAKKVILAAASCAALAVPIAIGCFTSASVRAQASAAEPYESILIREAAAGANRSFLVIWPFSRSFEIGNRTLRQLIAYAYDVDESRVSGPAWLGTTHYDIRATNTAQLDRASPWETSPAEFERYREKLQALLASRFGLVVNRSTATRAAYVLKIAEGGSRLKPPPQWYSAQDNIEYTSNGVHATAQSVSWLAEQLAGHLGAPIEDETGLAGLHAVDLAWGPEAHPFKPQPQPVPLTPGLLESALHDQLGLTLERRSLALEQIVVEAVEPPRNRGTPGDSLAYASVTIRLAAKDTKGMAIGSEYAGNSFYMRNGTLRDLIAAAYSIENRRISGGAWLDEPHLDVYMKGIPSWDDSSMGDRTQSLILRNILEQKLGVVVSRGKTDLDGYALKLAPGGLKASPVSPNAPPVMAGGKNHLDMTGYSLDFFAASSSGMAGGPVVNETGVVGAYDFHLSWGPRLPFNDPAAAVPINREKWREVLRDQAGLMLEPRKMPSDQLTVVSVKPVSEVLPLVL